MQHFTPTVGVRLPVCISRDLLPSYRTFIGSRISSIEWYHFRWPWVTSNPSFKVARASQHQLSFLLHAVRLSLTVKSSQKLVLLFNTLLLWIFNDVANLVWFCYCTIETCRISNRYLRVLRCYDINHSFWCNDDFLVSHASAHFMAVGIDTVHCCMFHYLMVFSSAKFYYWRLNSCLLYVLMEIRQSHEGVENEDMVTTFYLLTSMHLLSSCCTSCISISSLPVTDCLWWIV